MKINYLLPLMLLVILFSSNELFGQDTLAWKSYKDLRAEKVNKGLAKVGDLIDFDENYITPRILNTKLLNYQKNICGSSIASGKSFGSSATIDDKGATVNFGIGPSAHNLFFAQFTLKGQNNNGLVNILSKGGYGNTISGGATVTFFPKINRFGFYTADHYLLHNSIQKYAFCSDTLLTKEAIKKKINDFDTFYTKCGELINHMSDTLLTQSELSHDCDCINQYSSLEKQLISLGILPNKWLDIQDPNEKAIMISQIVAHENDSASLYVRRKMLFTYDSMQYAAEWTRLNMWWWNLGANLNETAYPIFDQTQAKSFYTRNFYNYYPGISFSLFNFLFVNDVNNTNTWIYPTISYFYKRNFNPDSLLTIQQNQPYIFGKDTLNQQKNQAQFYRKLAPNKDSFSIEIPVVVYFTQMQWGIDVAYLSEVSLSKSNSLFNGIQARLGVYIPVSIQGTKVITIEPLLRFTKLDQQGLNFIKDQVYFGFNVSVSLPKFVTAKKQI